MSSDLKKRMLHEAEESATNSFPDSWTPEKDGDFVFGKVVDIRDTTTKHGSSKVAEIEQENGECVSVWLNRIILKKLWDEKKPNIGDTVLILYKGPELSKTGSIRYHKYGLSVEKSDNTAKPEQQSETQNVLDYKQGPLYKAILHECDLEGGQDKDVVADRLVTQGFSMSAIREVLNLMLKDGILAESQNTLIVV